MSNKKTKYVIVTGGVLSGIGKGITAASLGALLNCAGLKVSAQKIDHYLNVDAGTLNPSEHGECFVMADGAETDLDLGHYERFLGVELNKNSITVSGRLMQELTERERAGKYLGKTIQLVPHLTNLIQEKITLASEGSDVHILEIGGTVGDYEALGAIEAVREFAQKKGRENFIFMHVAYVPFLEVSQEFKTKPLQNSVRDLREYGIVPDIIIARTERTPINGHIAKKVSLFCGVEEENVVVLPNADTIYRVPLTLQEKKIHEFLFKKFNIKWNKTAFTKAMNNKWEKVVGLVEKSKGLREEVRVAVVAKYLDNADSYYSVIESLKIAAWHAGVRLDYEWVDAEKVNEKDFKKYDGVLVPGGFGNRGVEGKILAAQYSLQNKKPYLGLCLGLQVAVIAAARIGGLKSANSEEFNGGGTVPNVIYLMDGQEGKQETGGTMRLGTYTCYVEKNTLAEKVFKKNVIEERHRHRYEVNQKFMKEIEKGGLKVSGFSKDKKLVELVEAMTTPGGVQHPFFLATQSHPEFLSRPWAPHPMFLEFIKACKRG